MSSRARTLANFGDGIATADIGDGQITTAKIADGDVTSAKLFSGFANGITMADQYRLSANVSCSGTITSNIERVDDASFGRIGTGITESSGTFSFPETGIYLVQVDTILDIAAGDGSAGVATNITTDNSSYSPRAVANDGNQSGTAAVGAASSTAFVDVTDVSNVKVQFETSSLSAGSNIIGNTSQNLTSFTFIRLGDT